MCDPQEHAPARLGSCLRKWGARSLLVIPLMAVAFLVYLGGRPLPADNSYCHVCHLNYQTDPLAEDHRERGIGCVNCHGPSDAHADDEASETAPDTMYPRARINASCQQCHSESKLSSTCRSAIATDAGTPEVCTSCHGQHGLTERTRKWDKETGRLIWSGGGDGMGM